MRPRPATLALLALAALQAAWLLAHFEEAYASPDASGYFVQAHLLLEHGRTGFDVESPLQYVGVPWLEVRPGHLESRYPPGLPLVLAVAWAGAGFAGALLVGPLLAVGCTLLLYGLGRRLVGERAALALAALLAATPIVQRQALHADAHVPAAFFALLAAWLALGAARSESPLRFALAGLSAGFLVAVRYPEAALIPALAAAGLAATKRGRGRALLWAGSAAALPIALLCVHNARAYGSPFRTGYALTHEQTAFALEALADHLPGYLLSLASEALGPFLPLGLIGGLLAAASRGASPAERAGGLLALLAPIPLFLLYAAYYWGSPGDATNRFFVPAIPFLLLGAGLLWRRLDGSLEGRPAARRALGTVCCLLVAGQVALGLAAGEERLARERIGTARNAAVRRFLDAHASAGDVVIANRAVQGGLEPLLRYRLVDDRLVPGGPRRAQVRTRNPNLRFLQDRAEAGRPSPHQADKLAALRRPFLAGPERRRARRVLAEIARWADGAEVFWLATPEEIDRFAAIAPPGFRAERIGEVALPTPPPVLPLVRRFPPDERVLPYWVVRPPLVAFRLTLPRPNPAGGR